MGVEPLGRRQEGANLRVELEVPERQGREVVCLRRQGRRGNPPNLKMSGLKRRDTGGFQLKWPFSTLVIPLSQHLTVVTIATFKRTQATRMKGTSRWGRGARRKKRR